VIGLPSADAKTIVRGTPGQVPYVLLQTRNGRVLSACALNAPRELRFARELISSGAVLDEAMLGDPDVRLADIVRDVKQRKVPA